MARKSKGRGTAAAFGLLLLFAGLVGGGVLYVMSVRRPAQTVEGFARAPVGCTTTLRFTETGTFYVFEDLGPAIDVPEGGCEPSADPAQTFAFELRGPNGPVVPRAAGDLSYDEDDRVGTSVARVEIDTAGEYEIVVAGDDPAVVAAVGRDPDDGVDELRQRAVVVALVGVVLGALLLLLAGVRSKRAAAFASPDGPGWGPLLSNADRIGPPDPPGVTRRPVNPHQPDQLVDIARPMSDVNDLLAQARVREPSSPWLPPTGDQAAVAAPAAPRDDQVLPKREPIERLTTGSSDAGDQAVTDVPVTDRPVTDEPVDDKPVDDVDPERPPG